MGAASGKGRHRQAGGRARRLAACALTFTIGLAASVRAEETFHFRDVERVVAFGDVHGAFDELTRLLRAAGVIDSANHWSGGATHLVSLGDLIDRGPRSRDVLDLMMRLETEAAERGGRVHVLLGNHELLNLTGDSRYLTDADWAAYAEAPDDSARALAEARRPEGEPLTAPAGYFAWASAFAPAGRYGAWLSARPALLAIDDTLFVHGGVSPVASQLGGLLVNALLATELPRLLRLGAELRESGQLPFGADLLAPPANAPQPAPESVPGPQPQLTALAANPVYGSKGPFWYRGNSWCPGVLEQPGLAGGLGAMVLRRVVVGHTPTVTREVTTRLGGKVIMLDTGMLASYYQGNARALVIERGRMHVVTDSGEPGVLLVQGPDINPPGWSDLDLEAALGSEPEPVAGIAADGSASFRLRERSVRARFIAASREESANEVAAYRFDRLLGLGMVPVTVATEWERESGVLVVDDARWLMEAERLKRELAFENWCAEGHPYQAVTVFDLLIGNPARTVATLAYDFTTHRIRLTGHGKAFTTRKRLPEFDAAQIPEAMLPPLRALDQKRLERIMKRGRAKAVLKRREIMLTAVDEAR